MTPTNMAMTIDMSDLWRSFVGCIVPTKCKPRQWSKLSKIRQDACAVDDRISELVRQLL